MKKSFVQKFLIFLGVLFLAIMLVLPLATVIFYAFGNGVKVFIKSVLNAEALKALQLTLIAAGIAVIANTVFGIFASFLITKFSFRFKKIFLLLIDIPLAVSPVVAGLMLVFAFGKRGWLGPVLDCLGIKIIFAVPGILIATIFVTFPLVFREIFPLMQSQGIEEEEAAAMMGANWFFIFKKITFPNIKWALLYGSTLCASRAIGEFGAVSVISGHLRGKTNTMTLYVEILFNEFELASAFSISSILVMISLMILIFRTIAEYKAKKWE
ncbi:MAG: sulfate ABC transporter permease subunit [Oscillospiraceae bacterium]|nr:sulfate ABC transporter permease subunit [Oscillospiraceae bacterium]